MNNKARFNVLPIAVAQEATPISSQANIGDIELGRIGFRNATTHARITENAAGYAEAQRDGFYIALSTDANLDGTRDSIERNFNAIYPQDVVALTQKCYEAFQSKVIWLRDYTLDFATDYMLRLELKNNAFYGTNGCKPYTKLVSYRTSACPEAATCEETDIAQAVISMLAQINDDENINGFITAEAFQDDNTTPLADDAAIIAWVDGGADRYPHIRFTISQPVWTPILQDIYDYTNPKEIDVELFKTAGFEGNGTITVTQEMKMEQTTGKEVQELERIAAGWNGKIGPYRELNAGLKNLNYLSSATGDYGLITLHYKTRSESGVLNYLNDASVVIACSHATGMDAIKTALSWLCFGSATGSGLAGC